MAIALDDLIVQSGEAADRLKKAQDAVKKTQEELSASEQELQAFQAGSPPFKREELARLSAELSNLKLAIAEKQARPPLLFGKDRHQQQLAEMQSSAGHLKLRVADLTRESEKRGLELPGLVQVLSNRRREEDARVEEAQQECGRIESALAGITRLFYEERIRPQCVALIEARVAKDRVAFVESSPKLENEISAFGSRVPGREVNRCWILYYYVMGFVCGEWSELEAAKTWLNVGSRVDGFCSGESDDHLLELAIAYDLCQNLRLWVAIGQNNPLRVVREHLGLDPLEVAERKILFVMKNSPEAWQRKFGEEQLDHLIELRKAVKRR